MRRRSSLGARLCRPVRIGFFGFNRLGKLTAVCYASGNAGGIFGPALYIGAMMGATVGGVAHSLFPHYTAGAGAYALVGMGTAFAGNRSRTGAPHPLVFRFLVD